MSDGLSCNDSTISSNKFQRNQQSYPANRMDIPKHKEYADKNVCIAVIWRTIIGLFPIFFVLYHI